jgi:uncharacterized membrane protein (DUF4010 family)
MHFDWLQQQGLTEINAFLTALGIGILMGMERERNPSAKAGLRTFALTALLAVTLALLGDRIGIRWLPAVGLALVGIAIVSAYRRDDAPDADPGTTTVLALLVCYALATMAWYDHATLAIMLGVASTVLLYFKAELRSLTLNLERHEVISILQFAALTFIVLPILPDSDVGPHDALNPRNIWLMVILIAGVGLAGYVALKFVGQRHGAPLLGLLGGLVSSTATTLVYARHGREQPGLLPLSALVIALANIVVLFRITVVVAVVNPALVASLAPPLWTGAALGLLATLPQWRSSRQQGDVPVPDVKNPTEMRAALGFGALYAIVLLVSALLSDAVGTAGVYGIALLSGATDVDAITLSSVRLHRLGTLAPAEVGTVVTLAVLSNIAFKLAIAFVAGGRALGTRCLLPMGAVAVGLVGGLLLGGEPLAAFH